MNQDQLKGNWQQLKGEIQQQWGKLSDDDLTQEQGNFNSVVGNLKKRYGYTKEEAEEKLNGFLKKLKNNNPDSLADSISEFAKNINDKVVDTTKGWQQYAKDNPAVSLGFAAAAGVILGLLLAGKKA